MEKLTEIAIPMPSNKSFGWVFTALFGVLALLSWMKGKGLNYPFIVLCLLFMATTLANPEVLTPLNRLWMRFGLLLHKVVSPLVLGILYFGVFTPMGWVMRARGIDPMRRKWEPGAPSYWIPRSGTGPVSLTQQF